MIPLDGTVIGIIDEIQQDGPRSVTVEDRPGLFCKEFVGNVFEIVLTDSVEPVSDSVVTGRVVGLGVNLTDGRLSDSSTDDDRSGIAGIEGRALNPWQWKVVG